MRSYSAAAASRDPTTRLSAERSPSRSEPSRVRRKLRSPSKSGRLSLERRRDVDRRPRVTGVRGRDIEVGKVKSNPALVLRWVDRHPDSLIRREVLLPGQRDERAVLLQEILDVAHPSSPSNGRRSSWNFTSITPPAWRNSSNPRCDAPNARSNKCDFGRSSTRAHSVSNRASTRAPFEMPQHQGVSDVCRLARRPGAAFARTVTACEMACLLPGGEGIPTDLRERALAIARGEALENRLRQVSRGQRFTRSGPQNRSAARAKDGVTRQGT